MQKLAVKLLQLVALHPFTAQTAIRHVFRVCVVCQGVDHGGFVAVRFCSLLSCRRVITRVQFLGVDVDSAGSRPLQYRKYF